MGKKEKMGQFYLLSGGGEERISIPCVTESQMREVDRIAVEEFQLGILQMMENAGRNLALLANRWISRTGEASTPKRVVVAAGSGGNGGGGLCAARHLHNQGWEVAYILTKPTEQFRGAAKVQLAILQAPGVHETPVKDAEVLFSWAGIILDALIGYSLIGAPRGETENLIKSINASGKPVISLDIPSGVNATSGEAPGEVVCATQTLTLGLPKPGLANPASGDLYLADIGIPPEVYLPLNISFVPFFNGETVLPIGFEAGEAQNTPG